MSFDETHTRDLGPDYPTATPTWSDPQPYNTDNSGDGPFDPGNTPPLVFAFIAIGFVTFGLIVAIIYKKFRLLQNPSEPNYQRSSVPIRRPLAQKPELWDIRIAPSKPVADEERENVGDWDTFVPLSASLVYPYSRSPPVRVPQQYVQGHVIRPIPVENPEHRLFFRHPPADTSLHVAVMISMPRAPRRQEPVPNQTHTENEFHVGVKEVKWSG